MPSLARRREIDIRSDRFESEVRITEIGNIERKRKGLPFCSNCNRAFEETSLYCPRCDKKTMGFVRPIPDDFKEQATRNAVRRAQSKAGS